MSRLFVLLLITAIWFPTQVLGGYHTPLADRHHGPALDIAAGGWWQEALISYGEGGLWAYGPRLGGPEPIRRIGTTDRTMASRVLDEGTVLVLEEGPGLAAYFNQAGGFFQLLARYDTGGAARDLDVLQDGTIVTADAHGGLTALRWTGTEFEVLASTPGFSPARAVAARSADLIVGTFEDRVTAYRLEGGEFVPRAQLPLAGVQDLRLEPSSTREAVVLVGPMGGPRSYTIEGSQFIQQDGIDGVGISTALDFRNTSQLYVGGDYGRISLFSYDEGAMTFVTTRQDLEQHPNGMLASLDHVLMIQRDQGLRRYAYDGTEILQLEHLNDGGPALAAISDGAGRILLASGHGGVRVLVQESGDLVQKAQILDDSGYQALAPAPGGGFYAASRHGGLWAFDMEGDEPRLRAAHATLFPEDIEVGLDGTVFLAQGLPSGVTAFRDDGDAFTVLAQGQFGGGPRRLALAPDGSLAAAFELGGVARLAFDGTAFTLLGRWSDAVDVMDVAVAADGTIFGAGDDRGLLAFADSESGLTLAAVVPTPGAARTLAVDASGMIHVATENGQLCAYRYAEGTFTAHGTTAFRGLPQAVSAASDGRILVCGDDSGLQTFGYTHSVATEPVEDMPAPPLRLRLTAHPNPFNPVVMVRWELAVPGPVRLEAYDLAGRLVARLHDGPAPTGEGHRTWDGTDRRGAALPSGAYLLRLSTRQGDVAAKVVLAR